MIKHIGMRLNGRGRFMFTCLFICSCVRAHAQTLNMYDAVSKTIANYPLLQERNREVAASSAHVSSVTDNRLPSLVLQDQLTAGTNNGVTGSYFPLGIMPSTSGGISNINNSTVNSGNMAIGYLQWQFYNFGYYNAQKKEALAALGVSQSQLNSDKYTLTENIISLYLDWLKKYRLYQIENENVHRAGTILNAIRATVNSGLKPGVDSATASASYADARIAYLQALDAYNNDEIALTTYTGINVSDIYPDTAIIEKIFQSNLLQANLSDSISSTHPLLDVYKQQYEEQLAANNTIAKKYLPKVGLDAAGWMRGSSISPDGVYDNNLSDGLPYSRYNYLFGLTLTYNLFDLKHRQDDLREGNYEAQARQSALQTQQLNLTKLLQQANSSYIVTTEKLTELPVQLHSAQQAYGQQLALYKAGLNTLIDVTNAEYVLRQTETNYVVAQDELLQLLYIRAGLSNQLDTFLQNFK
jgi:adhesin transport system outer membrane protein